MALKILDRRFISVIGKGGTGKTTVSAALAILAASRGKRVLVAMSQARERMSAMLETEFIGSGITPILPNIVSRTCRSILPLCSIPSRANELNSPFFP
jgi:MinD superfamily P-loop ATPase